MSAEQNNAQIARLRSAIAEAYAACSEKDATIPSDKIISGLAECIRSIQHGIPEGYINLADVISHCTRYVNSSYTPPSNQILNNVSITITDSNGEYLKPKVFIMFHNARIDNSGTDTAKVVVAASVTIAGDDGALLYRHSSGIYYHSTYKACSNQSSSRYFKPTSTGVQGVASDFYLQSGRTYLWHAWG